MLALVRAECQAVYAVHKESAWRCGLHAIAGPGMHVWCDAHNTLEHTSTTYSGATTSELDAALRLPATPSWQHACSSVERC
jgi:hypothetical protein